MTLNNLETAKLNLAAIEAEVEEANVKTDEANAECKALREKLNLAVTKANATEKVYLNATYKLAHARRKFNLAEANEAADNYITRKELVEIVEEAVAPTMPYGDGYENEYGKDIVDILDRSQYGEGFRFRLPDILANVEAPVLNKRGLITYRKLTAKQIKRVTDALVYNCPHRGDGLLGTPYKLTTNENGVII